MAKSIPFDEDTMTLIMGIGDPEKPGEHGRKMVPAPEQTAIELITQIRDLCEDFLFNADKGKEKEEKPEESDMESEEE